MTVSSLELMRLLSDNGSQQFFFLQEIQISDQTLAMILNMCKTTADLPDAKLAGDWEFTTDSPLL